LAGAGGHPRARRVTRSGLTGQRLSARRQVTGPGRRVVRTGPPARPAGDPGYVDRGRGCPRAVR